MAKTIALVWIIFGFITFSSAWEETVVICEHDNSTLWCCGGSVRILDANYGRSSMCSCPHPSIETASCAAAKSRTYVRSQCDGKAACTLEASNSVFGDPCVGTYKYLEVQFTCA